MDNNQNNQNQNNQNNNQNQNNQNHTPKRGGFFSSFGAYILIIILIIGVWFAYRKMTATKYETVEYSELTSAITEDRYIGGTAKPAGEINPGIYVIKGTFYEDAEHTKVVYYKINVTEVQYNELVGATYNVDITLKTLSTNQVMTWIMYLLPYVLIIGAIIIISKSTGNSKAFDFAKSNARKSNGGRVTFNDVAGCDEEKQELVEVVDFLKNPKKYSDMGARIPKGILLFGPPGTGKTLLARAVAGEAGVPFFSISGSEFVEMFVGVGASRVRDLFKQAKEQHPCIIFIDEIDAVGRQRGAGMGGGHDEREQTLNQLLVEMDGFATNLGIIVMAATNRPDVLDPALLRPGRFDRQITISSPDVAGREAILKVHARNKHLADDVKLDELAARIPGFSGADIENLLNEAAILAARDNRKVISAEDLDEATDRVMMGPAKKSRKYSDHEKDLVAHHEAGHAVIGLKLEHANVVQKVTIIPRGQAGGYTLMLPEEETYFETKRSLLDQITGLLGGRLSWLDVKGSWIFLIILGSGLLFMTNIEGDKLTVSTKEKSCIMISHVFVIILIVGSMIVGFTKLQGCIEGSGRCHGIRNSYKCRCRRSIIDGQFCRKVFIMDMNRPDQLGPESLEPVIVSTFADVVLSAPLFDSQAAFLAFLDNSCPVVITDELYDLVHGCLLK